MDKVKFGRALGKGARGVGKSLWEAAEAAAAPDPSPKAASRAEGRGPVIERPAPTLQEVAGKALEAHRLVNDAKRQVRTAAIGAAKQSGKGMMAPVRKFSSVVWLQVTGTFFAVITIFLLQGVLRGWKAMGGDWTSAAGHKFELYALVCALFAYFTVSSFVRASRRNKRA